MELSPDEFESLHERYKGPVDFYVALRRRSLPPELFSPEDLTQEVWLRFLRWPPSLPDDPTEQVRDFKAWLKKVVGTCVDQEIRRASTRLAHGEPIVAYRPDWSGISSATRSAYTKAASSDGIRRIQEAVDSLDARESEVLRYRLFEELSHNQIAEVLGITPDNSRQIYTRARRQLIERLGPDADALPEPPSDN